MRKPACLVRDAGRVLLVLSFLVIASSVASAYTIVMLGGRRIQIPEHFTVTKNTLTYDVGATISATLLIAAIDVSATERANNEPPGSFLKRALQGSSQAENLASSESRNGLPGRGVVTNESLERYAITRRASEAAYEKRRIELGLPTLAESRRKSAAAADALSEIAEAEFLREDQSEEYWRGRAAALRDDLAYVDGVISFLQARLDEIPANPFAGAIVIGNGPFFGVGQSRVGQSLSPALGPRRSVFVAPSNSRQFSSVGAEGRGRVLMNPAVPGPRLRGPFRPRFGVSTALFGSLSSGYNFTYDSSALRLELDRLLSVRAGLEASQRELEDDARRAGAFPGWLRP